MGSSILMFVSYVTSSTSICSRGKSGEMRLSLMDRQEISDSLEDMWTVLGAFNRFLKVLPINNRAAQLLRGVLTDRNCFIFMLGGFRTLVKTDRFSPVGEGAACPGEVVGEVVLVKTVKSLSPGTNLLPELHTMHTNFGISGTHADCQSA